MANDIANHLSEYLEGNARLQGFGNPQFQQRLLQFLNENPYGVGIKSLDRDQTQQAQLWQDALAKYGSAEAARKWVAPPGSSNHNKGVAADLSYEDPQARQWAHANAMKYGLKFPLRNEAWHVEPAETRGGSIASEFTGSRIPQGTLADALPGATLPSFGASNFATPGFVPSGAPPLPVVAAVPDPASMALVNTGPDLQKKQQADAEAEQKRRQALFGAPPPRRGSIAGLFA